MKKKKAPQKGMPAPPPIAHYDGGTRRRGGSAGQKAGTNIQPHTPTHNTTGKKRPHRTERVRTKLCRVRALHMQLLPSSRGLHGRIGRRTIQSQRSPAPPTPLDTPKKAEGHPYRSMQLETIPRTRRLLPSILPGPPKRPMRQSAPHLGEQDMGASTPHAGPSLQQPTA